MFSLIIPLFHPEKERERERERGGREEWMTEGRGETSAGTGTTCMAGVERLRGGRQCDAQGR